jgi:hypothetical protein
VFLQSGPVDWNFHGRAPILDAICPGHIAYYPLKVSQRQTGSSRDISSRTAMIHSLISAHIIGKISYIACSDGRMTQEIPVYIGPLDDTGEAS